MTVSTRISPGHQPLLRLEPLPPAGARLSWLEHTPVKDFLLSGVFLLGVYGIGGQILIAGLIWRPSPGPLHGLDEALGYHWAWVGSIAFGVTLVL